MRPTPRETILRAIDPDLDLLDEAVISVDPDGRPLAWNAAATGYLEPATGEQRRLPADVAAVLPRVGEATSARSVRLADERSVLIRARLGPDGGTVVIKPLPSGGGAHAASGNADIAAAFAEMSQDLAGLTHWCADPQDPTAIDAEAARVVPEDRPSWTRARRRLLDQGEVHDNAFDAFDAEGCRGAYRETARSVRDPATGRRLLVGVVQDMTEHRDVENRLRERDQELVMLARSVPGLIYDRVRHPDGTVEFPVSMGEMKDQILARAGDLFEGREFTLHPLLDPTESARIKRAFDASASDLRPVDQTFRYSLPGEAPRWARARARPRRRSDGAVVWVGVVVDVTDLKETEAELRRSQEMLRRAQKMESLGTLASGVAHDFNNLLQPILTFAELAREDQAEGSQSVEMLDAIARSAERGRDLVGRILQYARRERSATKTPLDFADAISDALRLMRATLPPTIEFEYERDREVWVASDPGLVHQMLANLVQNAADAMKGRGTVRVSATAECLRAPREMLDRTLDPGDYARLSVRDSGGGIDPEAVERIFEPFYTTKDVGRGTGLGLAMVHGIACEHAGAVAAVNRPGDGAEIVVLIPRAGPA